MGRVSKLKKKQKQAKKILSIFVILIALAISLVAYLNPGLFESEPTDEPPVTDAGSVEETGEVQIHVIDVGQGDSILLTAPGGNVLFDAGDLAERHETAIKNYLTDLGITTLDYFIITHPDADHIGGADMVLREFTVKNVEEDGEPILCAIEDEEELKAVYDLIMDELYAEEEDED